MTPELLFIGQGETCRYRLAVNPQKGRLRRLNACNVGIDSML